MHKALLERCWFVFKISALIECGSFVNICCKNTDTKWVIICLRQNKYIVSRLISGLAKPYEIYGLTGIWRQMVTKPEQMPAK